MHTRVAFLALALLAACGKGDKTPQPSGEAKVGAPAPGGGGKVGEAAAAARPAPRGDVNRLFDLADNRLLAHQQRSGGLLVAPGAAGFAKYVHFAKPKLAWKLQEKLDGKRVGLADKYASLEVPLTAEQAAGSITLRVKAAGKRILEIKPNGGKAVTVELIEGWQTVSAPVPGLRAGENRVQLVAGGKGDSLAFEWIQFGGTPGGDEAPSFWDDKQKALVASDGSGLTYYTFVPDKGLLVGDVIGAGCGFAVKAAADGGVPVEGKLSAAGSVDLASLGGKFVRLDLVATGCKEARLANAALALNGAAPTVKKDGKKPKYVVWWIMDSLRADRTRPYNPKARAETPVFEKLAGKGALFMRTYVQGNESKASHAAMWSSTWTGTHRFIPGGNNNLDGKFVTIDELMKGAGFFNSGVSANGYITKKWGFGDKWDKYRNHIHDGGGVRGEDVLKFAIESVTGKKEPWFLYVGTIDTHVSWRAKEPWMSKYDSEPYSGKYVKEASGKDIEQMATSGKQPGDRDKQRIVAIYDSNVSYQDDLLGKLFDKLNEWGIAEDTMVIVTADHGDEQWEDGRVGHGASLRESLIHVPLLVYYPPLVPAGIVQEGADTIDILPTIADALGLSAPDGAMGESLIPLAQGVGRGYPRCSTGSMYENAWAMRCGDYKARVAGSGTPMIFNLADDYYEKNDLAEKRFIERRYITDALSTFLVYQKDWKKRTLGSANNMKPGAVELLEKK